MEKIKKLMYEAKAINAILPILIFLLLSSTGCEQPNNTPVAVSSIAISSRLQANAIVFNEGNTFRLTADIQPVNATDKTVVWTSSNEGVASVSTDGTVTIKGVGYVTITAEAGGKSASDTFLFYEGEDLGYYFNETEKTYYIWNSSGLFFWNSHVTNKDNYVESTNSYGDKCYVVETNAVLMNDITIPDPVEGQSNWVPVGYYDDKEAGGDYSYAGTFDGGGHTISNLEINDNNYLGLFACIANTGVVKNLTLNDVAISGANYTGGITGNNYGAIENCSVSGSISGTYGAGGIAGYSNGKISGCYNMGDVSGFSDVGGIAGENYCIITDCYNTGEISGTEPEYIGGIAGENHGTIETCHNTGNVSGSYDVGGIAGENYGTTTDCYNIGEVSGYCNIGGIAGENYETITACYNTGNISGSEYYIGGIAGYNKEGTIKNCYASGSVSGCYGTGGIAGCNGENGIIAACYNAGSVSGSGNCNGGIAGENYWIITACYNIGEISGTESECVGGIAGDNKEKATITACYNTGNISGYDYVGGIAGEHYGTITACYWSVPEGSLITSGIGDHQGSDPTTKVDGAWDDALSGMNGALTEAEYGYSYQENDDPATKETMPLVIVKSSN